jgi:hypothetical protein
MAPDVYEPFRTTFPKRLLAAAKRRAAKHPAGTVAAYLADLIRADLAAAGEPVPEPPPPKQNGPKKGGSK